MVLPVAMNRNNNTLPDNFCFIREVVYQMLLFFLLNNWNFFLLVMVLMIIGGLVSYALPRLSPYLIVLIFAVIGYFYAVYFQVPNLALELMAIICIFTLIPITLVKYTIYLRQVAERFEKEQETKKSV